MNGLCIKPHHARLMRVEKDELQESEWKYLENVATFDAALDAPSLVSLFATTDHE